MSVRKPVVPMIFFGLNGKTKGDFTGAVEKLKHMIAN
jgi:hypothetical protein